jgi:glycine cleavage system H protein
MACKTLNELEFNGEVQYSEEHTWARVEGGLYVIGISDYAQDQLGEIIFIQLPEKGDLIQQGGVFGFVESVKTASDLYMPVPGEIVETNGRLEDSPELVNEDPYHKGWMVKVKSDCPADLPHLLSAAGYKNSLE